MGLSVANEIIQKLDRTAKGQVATIDRTFTNNANKTANLASLKHPTKRDLKATEVLPIFPDFEYYTNPYVSNTFNDDPTGREVRIGGGVNTQGTENAAEDEARVNRIQEAVFKPLEDADGQFMAMYLPDAASYEKLRQRREAHGDENFEFVIGEKFEYEHVRNYDHTLEKDPQSRRLAISVREGAAWYTIPRGILKLKRRRAKVC
jgi:RNA polymerase II-associated factor 1